MDIYRNLILKIKTTHYNFYNKKLYFYQKIDMKKLNIVLILVFCDLLFGCSDGEDVIDEPLNFGNLITIRVV